MSKGFGMMFVLVSEENVAEGGRVGVSGGMSGVTAVPTVSSYLPCTCPLLHMIRLIIQWM